MQGQSPTMLKQTYQETLDLMIEARNYLAYKGAGERRGMDQTSRLKMSCEAFRLTSRLTQVMAWVMAQRAVQAGEIALTEAVERFALDGEDVCLDASAEHDADLPDGLRRLMDRSHRLYARISRLDDMVRRQAMH